MDNNVDSLTIGSLFSGSGGFELAGLFSGIIPKWNCEIEPFPIAVTRKQFPDVKHYGDISKLDGACVEPVDIITFGSPCQDMSVAGKRDGLDGSRSSLFYEAIRIIKEMMEKTNGEYPKYAVWENVAGAFSSNRGEDFRCVLESFCKTKDAEISIPRHEKWEKAGCIMGGDFSVAWRTLDAQYWGVPQRRKRIYLVADFTGECAGKILFESEGLSGYSAEGFRAWQRTAENLETGTGTAGGENERLVLCDQGGNRMDVLKDKVSTIRAEAHHPPIVMESAGFCTEHSAKSRSIGYEEETLPTLRAGVVPAAVALENHPTDGRVKFEKDGNVQTLTERMGTDGNNVPLLMEYKVYGIGSKKSNAMLSDNPKSGFYEAETTRTLDGNGGNPNCNQGGIAVVAIEGNGTRPSHHGDGYSEEDVSYTLNATEHHGVAYGIDRAAFNQGKNALYDFKIDDNINSSLVAKDPSAVCVGNSQVNQTRISDKVGALNCMHDQQCVMTDENYIVRRLTPTECARLQGFPDWWCDDLGIENPSEEDIGFWKDVFETHRKVITHSSKQKTEKQIIKWIKDPHSDSAEYKMWGNGIALPCAAFVLSGIMQVENNKKEIN